MHITKEKETEKETVMKKQEDQSGVIHHLLTTSPLYFSRSHLGK